MVIIRNILLDKNVRYLASHIESNIRVIWMILKKIKHPNFIFKPRNINHGSIFQRFCPIHFLFIYLT